MDKNDLQDATPAISRRAKLGLALSGGGFRASIFHLGVIRRLEELGIMPSVNVISSVSGGSIIAAYYVIQMEELLRERRKEIEAGRDITEIRVELFEEIAREFFRAVDHNLRTRAMVFAPFYHPIAFLKMLRPGYNRSNIIQAEFDRWFYRDNTLDQLPSVVRELDGASSYLAGPKLVLNTTSLLTGQRKVFCREPISGIKDLTKVNTNVLPLSRIVGASAGVPGLFPPTLVSGKLLVDGGVSDNQGLEGLWQEACDTLIISDASGQMELVHRLKSTLVPVLLRTNSIFQFQIRTKLIDELLRWQDQNPSEREFAFVHLFLNLKDRPEVEQRVPSEYIPGLARIRTDLDQFSFIEREALMYHGYTLIDGQLKKHCPRLMRGIGDLVSPRSKRELCVPPLFTDQTKKSLPTSLLARREEIKKHLKAGSQSVFIFRSFRRHGWKAISVFILTWVIPVALFFILLFPRINAFAERVVQASLGVWLASTVPEWVAWVGKYLDGYIQWPVTLRGATVLIAFLAFGYIMFFITYVTMRKVTRRWDQSMYRRLTSGQFPAVSWRAATIPKEPGQTNADEDTNQEE